MGVDVHIAARIGAAGHGGQILLSEAAANLSRSDLGRGISLVDLGSYELKGITGRHRIFQLVAADLPSNFPLLRPPARIAAAPVP